VDDRDYRYPVIEVEELHLWEKKDPYRFYDPYWGSPFYYDYPWRRSPYGYW
jgi:starvation-inducible outer membrane lipoprotein